MKEVEVQQRKLPAKHGCADPYGSSVNSKMFRASEGAQIKSLRRKINILDVKLFQMSHLIRAVYTRCGTWFVSCRKESAFSRG